ncbi:glutamyl-tRNA(Gln) amidotransferase subunit A [Rhizoctonia solani AG-1 IA]|uniref:Glutamyl-tRNA(Gln) amidotransferase subunit A n=1 Tax=Thanatephorus cucumeris (strain AG1-IA) TaxID=983506 RepID=L8WX70_THACA|nr:glutamyl-tRNA(Gln) amidotransferase subunit A [Rhizoctonia solani AG-1 IA]
MKYMSPAEDRTVQSVMDTMSNGLCYKNRQISPICCHCVRHTRNQSILKSRIIKPLTPRHHFELFRNCGLWPWPPTTTRPINRPIPASLLDCGLGCPHVMPGMAAAPDTGALPLSSLDLYEASIPELEFGLDSGHFTSVDLVKAYLGRIDQVNHVGPKLNAVIETNTYAIEQARVLDIERKMTGKRSILHGIPILLKDNIATLTNRTEPGMNTTAGSHALLGSIVRNEATVAAKLRKAGAIILGKTNLSEWSQARGNIPIGWSGRGGQTTNPYFPGANPCGSSSGSGVAMAIGLAAGSLGTETDGSITCPSKEKAGLTGRRVVIPISIHQDTVGPIARSVTDAAIILTAIAGRDGRDNFTSNAPDPALDYTRFLDPQSLKGKRIGVPRKFFMDTTLDIVHPSIKIEFEKALGRVKELGGVIVDPADLPSAEEILTSREVALNAYIASLDHVPTNVTSVADIIRFNDAHKELEETEGHEDQSGLILCEATLGYNSTYHEALRQNYLIGRDRGIDAALKDNNLDALLLPSDGETSVVPAAMAGYPIVTVPLGFHPRDTKPLPETQAPYETLYPAPGIPFGLSFIGTAYTEPSLIGFAYAYEQYTNTRLERRAYKEAIPTIQLKDVITDVESGHSGVVRPGLGVLDVW